MSCPKITAAIHRVMSEVGYIQKTGENKFHGYKYAGEAALLAKLRPAMLEAGLLLIPSGRSISPIDAHGNTSVEVEYSLVHKDGEVWPEKLIAYGCGNDRSKSGAVGDKGIYKALTGANKYFLFKLFQIETGNDPEQDSDADDEAPPARPAPSKAPASPARPALAASNGKVAPPSSKPTDPATIRDKARGMAREGRKAFDAWYRALKDTDADEVDAIAEELAEIGAAVDQAELARA